ncbi:MAG: IS110 family transposase [Candidatus Lokiarchaeota archaeon]|nr:IS110 family transposase [Candidatus Lokiarchaeota archaeon]
MKNTIKSHTQGKKTDKLDAKRIAIAHRDGRLKPSVISPQEIMALRKAMRVHTRLVEDSRVWPGVSKAFGARAAGVGLGRFMDSGSNQVP